MLDIPVVVGRETYQKWKTLMIGFKLGSAFDPIPNPDFNLFELVKFNMNPTRLELHSPECQYYAKVRPETRSKSQPFLGSAADAEEWSSWFILIGISGKKVILEQEPL